MTRLSPGIAHPHRLADLTFTSRSMTDTNSPSNLTSASTLTRTPSGTAATSISFMVSSFTPVTSTVVTTLRSSSRRRTGNGSSTMMTALRLSRTRRSLRTTTEGRFPRLSRPTYLATPRGPPKGSPTPTCSSTSARASLTRSSSRSPTPTRPPTSASGSRRSGYSSTPRSARKRSSTFTSRARCARDG